MQNEHGEFVRGEAFPTGGIGKLVSGSGNQSYYFSHYTTEQTNSYFFVHSLEGFLEVKLSLIELSF